VARSEFIKVLAKELTVESSTPRQPFIFEQEIPETDTFHVIVFWERWTDVPPEERSSIILDAYEQADPATAPNVTIAMGVTMDEAIRMNLLPFRVESAIRNANSGVNVGKLKKTMLEQGAVERSGGLELRFPTRQLAEEALERLCNKAPEGNWTIAETVVVPED
jgi:hypothetical protein